MDLLRKAIACKLRFNVDYNAPDDIARVWFFPVAQMNAELSLTEPGKLNMIVDDNNFNDEQNFIIRCDTRESKYFQTG